MLDGLYRDILIASDDIALDVGGQPREVVDRDSIAQDLVHMIRESGLLVEMVANRDKGKRAANAVRVIVLVDNDERIVPGSSEIEEVEAGRFYLTCETVDFGLIELEVRA